MMRRDDNRMQKDTADDIFLAAVGNIKAASLIIRATREDARHTNRHRATNPPDEPDDLAEAPVGIGIDRLQADLATLEPVSARQLLTHNCGIGREISVIFKPNVYHGDVRQGHRKILRMDGTARHHAINKPGDTVKDPIKHEPCLRMQIKGRSQGSAFRNKFDRLKGGKLTC